MPTNEADAFTTKYIRSYKQIIALLNALANLEKLPADKQAEYMQYEYVFFDSFTALTEVVEKLKCQSRVVITLPDGSEFSTEHKVVNLTADEINAMNVYNF